MGEFRRTIDEVTFESSYIEDEERAEQAEIKRRTLSKPKKNNFKRFIDKNKKIIATLLIAGTTLGVVGAVGAQHIEEATERSKIAATFEDAIESTYESSEFLQVSFREEDYEKYSKEVIKDTLRAEEALVDFLQAEDVDKDVWLYILSGEGNRFELEDKKILSALKEYEPYSEEFSFDKETGDPDKTVSYFSQLATVCLSEENEKDCLALFDAAVGSTSLSNGPEAIEYQQGQIEEIRNKMETLGIDSLEDLIDKNANFGTYYSRNKQALQPYFSKLYNVRVESARDIESGEAFTNVRDQNYLQRITSSVAHHPLIEDPYAEIATGRAVIVDKVATKDEYKTFREMRNSLYQFCIDGLDDREGAKEILDTMEKRLENKSKIYEQYETRKGTFLEDIYELFDDIAEHQKAVDKANERIKKTRFGDFSR